MLLCGALMSFYFQFSKFLSSMEFLKESGGVPWTMHSSFLAFSLSILIGAAYVFEKMIVKNTPVPLRAVSRR